MLVKTTLDDNHEHLVRIDPSNGMAECAKTKKHVHVVEWDNDAQALVVLPAEDGHVHDIEELVLIEPELPKDKEDETTVIDRVYNQYNEAYDAELLSIIRGQESIEFREGIQWPSDTMMRLGSENRACLTINHIAPMIETLSGVARQNRTDIKVFPVQGGDQFTADILTQTIKQICAENSFEFEEIEQFEDQISAGRGVLEVYPDYDENVEGNIKVKYVPWDMITTAPHMRKDRSDAEYDFKWKWVSKAQLENLYPEYKTEIGDMYLQSGRHLGVNTDTDTLTRDSVFLNPTYTNNQTKQLRLLECESKEYYAVMVYIDETDGFIVGDDQLPQNLSTQLKTLKGLKNIRRKLFRLRKTVIAGDMLFEDDYVDGIVPNNMNGPAFSTIVTYAYKRGLYFEGKIERVKDPQREINKRRSQTVDIVNTSINNGWFYESDTFNTLQDEENFKRNSSTAGFTCKVEDLSRIPVKVESGTVERAIVELEQNSQRSFREVSNINTEMLGQSPSYQSGVALQNQQRTAMMGNEYLFDNHNRGKKELGCRLILWIQKIYTPERIGRMVLNQAMVDKVFLNKERLDPQNEQAVQMFMQKVQQMLDNADLSKYDVAIGEANSTPTTQMANLQSMMEMARAGVPIPPMALLEMAPIPNKEKIMEMLQQQQQTEADNEKGKQDTEILKTKIANQNKGGTPQ